MSKSEGKQGQARKMEQGIKVMDEVWKFATREHTFNSKIPRSHYRKES